MEVSVYSTVDISLPLTHSLLCSTTNGQTLWDL